LISRCSREYRTRLLARGLDELALDVLLARLGELGLVKAGGKQRTDATHVLWAVRDLNRLELAGESVWAALEVIAVAAPGWLAGAIDLGEWTTRYGRRVDSWRLPASAGQRDELAAAYGADVAALCRALTSPGAPAWLRELPAVAVLRTVGDPELPHRRHRRRAGGDQPGGRHRTVSRRAECG